MIPIKSGRVSRADEREDFVRTEFGARCECHFVNRAVQLRTMVNGVGGLSESALK